MVHSCRDFFFFSLASLGASSPSRERISWAAARLALAWAARSSATRRRSSRRSLAVQQLPAGLPHRLGVGLQKGLIGLPVQRLALEQGGDVRQGQHLFEQAQHEQRSQVLFAVLFLLRVGQHPVFHVVVHHRAGEHPALHLPLEKGQALVAVVQHLVHVKGDGRQLLPAGQRLFLSRPGPGGHVPFLLRHLRSLLCGSFLQFTRWERESQFRLPSFPNLC